MFYESIESEVGNIRVPTLIIAGESDPLFNAEYINKRILPNAPDARTVILPCGHEIPFEMPNETAWLVEAFVAGLHR
jgi:pimeloyl-ACP methyl ester carboxylesterase